MSQGLISHVGIAVADLEQSIRSFEKLTGRKAEPVENLPAQRVRLTMLGNHSESRIELLQGTSPDSPIAAFIAKRGEGLHHVCIYVDDIEAKLLELRIAGFRLIDEKPRNGAGGVKIAFVHPAGTGGVLLELEERST